MVMKIIQTAVIEGGLCAFLFDVVFIHLLSW